MRKGRSGMEGKDGALSRTFYDIMEARTIGRAFSGKFGLMRNMMFRGFGVRGGEHGILFWHCFCCSLYDT